jgi:hypothetical protein
MPSLQEGRERTRSTHCGRRRPPTLIDLDDGLDTTSKRPRWRPNQPRYTEMMRMTPNHSDALCSCGLACVRLPFSCRENPIC